jgi:hypothetical protein
MGWTPPLITASDGSLRRKWSSTASSAFRRPSSASMADDVIEMTVERPPKTPEEALALAREQFLFAPALVHHGTQNRQVLASALCGGTVWWFCLD